MALEVSTDKEKQNIDHFTMSNFWFNEIPLGESQFGFGNSIFGFDNIKCSKENRLKKVFESILLRKYELLDYNSSIRDLLWTENQL